MYEPKSRLAWHGLSEKQDGKLETGFSHWEALIPGRMLTEFEG